MSDFLWVEKYRPKVIADCVLPIQLFDTFSAIRDKGALPNMMFAGSAGVGKTTVAKALCNELDMDYIIINGSMDANMESLRGKIKQFASTVSLMDGKVKVVILDEADYLSPQVQASLRGFIEEFSNNCRFILTCNFKNRIIEPLHSRCSVYDFSIPTKEKAKIAAGMFKRTLDVLEAEGITYNKKAVAAVVEKYFPDFRRVLGELQRYSVSGTIDAGVLANVVEDNVSLLIKCLKDKDFKTMRKWVVDNIDMESTAIFRGVYDSMSEKAQPQSIPQIVITLAEYQHKDAFVADKEINIVACMTELMANTEWK